MRFLLEEEKGSRSLVSKADMNLQKKKKQIFLCIVCIASVLLICVMTIKEINVGVKFGLFWRCTFQLKKSGNQFHCFLSIVSCGPSTKHKYKSVSYAFSWYLSNVFVVTTVKGFSIHLQQILWTSNMEASTFSLRILVFLAKLLNLVHKWDVHREIGIWITTTLSLWTEKKILAVFWRDENWDAFWSEVYVIQFLMKKLLTRIIWNKRLHF